MKHFFKIIVLLFCFTIQAQEKEKIATDQLDSELQSDEQRNATAAISKEHLNVIFSDLIKKKAFSEKNIRILDNYELLKDYRFLNKNYSFGISKKTELGWTKSNQVLFWRMDINATKAFYELYVKLSDSKNMKYEFHFELINNKWILKQQ